MLETPEESKISSAGLSLENFDIGNLDERAQSSPSQV